MVIYVLNISVKYVFLQLGPGILILTVKYHLI